jgi:purine-binding chemotaxis protein CheW
VGVNTATNEIVEQLVVFTLGEESYGVSIAVVNTIIRLPEITCVPHTAPYVKGVINLRGVIVPVIDLRVRFGLPSVEAQKATRVIVVEHDAVMVGMIVDAVAETLRLPVANIEPLSPLVQSIDAQYLRGVGKLDDRLIILLALDKVLQHEDVEALEQVLSPAAQA